MGSLTVPGAVAAPAQASGAIPGEGCASLAEFGEGAPELARRSTAGAMPRALSGRDRALVASRPAGFRTHSHRGRTLATMAGDVRLGRTVLLDRAGSTVCPLDDGLGLPMGDRVGPSARGFPVTCGADAPSGRTARPMGMGGGSRVSAATVMGPIGRAGEAVAANERKAARDPFSDGAAPEADAAAARVLAGAGGTYVAVRGQRAKAGAKAMAAYAGKEGSPGGRVSRAGPVRIGCVGVSPGEFRREAVAQVGGRLGLAKAERASLGTDGEARYVNGIPAMPFAAEPDGHTGPFHVDRAVARCAKPGDRLGWALPQALEAGGPEARASAIDPPPSVGALRDGSEEVADCLRERSAEVGGGPPMGTMGAERQHAHKSRMASFPCAWSLAGADAMARVRSWASSGGGIPRRSRGESASPKRRARRDAKVAAPVGPTPSRRASPEGRGWELPVAASVEGLRADIRHEASLDRM